MRETPARFGREGSLVGVLTDPSWASSAQCGETDDRRRRRELPGVVFSNAGLVHRVGANRLHVTLARKLAAKGIASLRFDHSGIGDSPPARDNHALRERRIAEIREAMRVLGDATGTDRFLLCGHCSGALYSFVTAQSDPRVMGLGLLNPPGKLLARHFFRTFLRHPAAWRRLFAGQATIGRQVARLVRQAGASPGPKEDVRQPDLVSSLQALATRGVDVLFVYSEWDTGLDYFNYSLRKAIRAPEMKEKVRCEIVPGADHGFSLLSHQKRVLEILDDWTERICRTDGGGPSPSDGKFSPAGAGEPDKVSP
jgi:pimeloyl-ACP methyl ester carboxylesterase